MTTISAASFNRDVSAAKRAAGAGPVVITDRGEPAFVLLSFENFQKLNDQCDIVSWLQMDEDIDFEPVVSAALPVVAEF